MGRSLSTGPVPTPAPVSALTQALPRSCWARDWVLGAEKILVAHSLLSAPWRAACFGSWARSQSTVRMTSCPVHTLCLSRHPGITTAGQLEPSKSSTQEGIGGVFAPGYPHWFAQVAADQAA